MSKDLPKVYASPINKTLNNNKDVYYSSAKTETRKINVDIPKKINEIFASVHHVYKSKVHIETQDDSFDTVIVGKTETHLLTLNGDKISINSITDIEKI